MRLAQHLHGKTQLNIVFASEINVCAVEPQAADPHPPDPHPPFLYAREGS
jgi:hypothetical protein